MEQEKKEVVVSKGLLSSLLLSIIITFFLIFFIHMLGKSVTSYDYRRNPPEITELACPLGSDSYEWGANIISAAASSVFSHLGIFSLGVVVLTIIIFFLRSNKIVVK